MMHKKSVMEILLKALEYKNTYENNRKAFLFG